MPKESASIRVIVPEAIEGEVMLALNRARGVVTLVRREGEHSTCIGAAVPRKGLAGFQAWLQQFSNGQGHVSEDAA
jgi:translation elongation factor EF-G